MVIAAARMGLRRHRIAAAPAFVPTQLAGLALWLDAGQITGATDGAAVATWQDRSGNARDATQATAAKQPIYRSTGTPITPSGKPVVQFDAVDDTVSGALAAIPQPVTAYLVLRRSASPAFEPFIDLQPAGGSGGRPILSTQQGPLQVYAGTASNAATLIPATGYHVVSTLWNDAASSLYIDGAADVLTGAAGTSGVTNGYTLNTFSNGTNAAGLCYAEVLVYSTAHSTTERQQVEGYLRSRHGTP